MMMETFKQHFLNHLIQIGIATSSTLDNFLAIHSYYKKNLQPLIKSKNTKKFFPEIEMRDELTKSLSLFIDSMNSEMRHQIAVNIYSKFIQKNIQIKAAEAYKLMMIYKTHQTQSQRLRKRIKFKHWKKFLKNTTYTTFINMSTQIDKSKKLMNTTNLFKSSKENKDLLHCTFQPMINSNKRYFKKSFNDNYSKENTSNLSSIHDKLYNDHHISCLKKERKIIENNSKIGEINTFKPRFISNSPREQYNNFNERSDLFEYKKKENKEKMKLELEKDASKNCSFTPNIDVSQKAKSPPGSPSKNKIPAFQRLYELNETQKVKKSNDFEKEIKLKASSSASCISTLNKGFVDYAKIEELYNDHKRLKDKLDEKRTKLDIERGFTFSPKLSTSNNEKYANINNVNFYEREKKFIEDKKKFVDIFHEIYEEHSKGQRWGNQQYSSNKEKKEITKGVVERLYGKLSENKNYSSNNSIKQSRIYHSKLDEEPIYEESHPSDYHSNSYNDNDYEKNNDNNHKKEEKYFVSLKDRLRHSNYSS